MQDTQSKVDEKDTAGQMGVFLELETIEGWKNVTFFPTLDQEIFPNQNDTQVMFHRKFFTRY